MQGALAKAMLHRNMNIRLPVEPSFGAAPPEEATGGFFRRKCQERPNA
jgi:hypothetical protein